MLNDERVWQASSHPKRISHRYCQDFACQEISSVSKNYDVMQTKQPRALGTTFRTEIILAGLVRYCVRFALHANLYKNMPCVVGKFYPQARNES